MDPGKDADKILQVKQDLEKMLQEAMYLGIPAADLHEMIRRIDGSKGGSWQDDSND